MTNTRSSFGGAIGVALLLILTIVAVGLLVWIVLPGPGAGVVIDEARAVKRAASTFLAADEDFAQSAAKAGMAFPVLVEKILALAKTTRRE